MVRGSHQGSHNPDSIGKGGAAGKLWGMTRRAAGCVCHLFMAGRSLALKSLTRKMYGYPETVVNQALLLGNKHCSVPQKASRMFLEIDKQYNIICFKKRRGLTPARLPGYYWGSRDRLAALIIYIEPSARRAAERACQGLSFPRSPLHSPRTTCPSGRIQAPFRCGGRAAFAAGLLRCARRSLSAHDAINGQALIEKRGCQQQT